MTTITSHPAPAGSPRRPFPFLRLALAALLFGLPLLAVGLRYSYADHYDPPYQLLTETTTAQGQSHKEVLGNDGTVYTFTGDEQAATEWFHRIDDQLTARHYTEKLRSLGNGLGWAGTLLAGAGLLLAAAGAVAAVRRVRSRSRG